MGTTITIQSAPAFDATNDILTATVGPLNISINSPVMQTNAVTFSSATFESVTGPSGASIALIVPPTGNTEGLTLKGITGDTGIAISPSNPTLLALLGTVGTSQTIGLASAGAISGVVEILWL